MSPPPIADVGPFRDDLRRLYDELDAEVAALAPVCRLSGRCCRFAEYGHTLFLSAPEFALLLADAPPPSRPLDDGQTCPWQDQAGRCDAREARPLGCRVYFCEPSAYQGPSHALSESYIARLKALADSGGLPWGYAPLHHHLRVAAEAGRFPRVDGIEIGDGDDAIAHRRVPESMPIPGE